MKRKYPSEAEAKAKAYAVRAKTWAANAAILASLPAPLSLPPRP